VRLGYFLTMKLSANRYDKTVEAATTGALFVGPLLAGGAMVVTWLLFV